MRVRESLTPLVSHCLITRFEVVHSSPKNREERPHEAGKSCRDNLVGELVGDVLAVIGGDGQHGQMLDMVTTPAWYRRRTETQRGDRGLDDQKSRERHP